MNTKRFMGVVFIKTFSRTSRETGKNFISNFDYFDTSEEPRSHVGSLSSS